MRFISFLLFAVQLALAIPQGNIGSSSNPSKPFGSSWSNLLRPSRKPKPRQIRTPDDLDLTLRGGHPKDFRGPSDLFASRDRRQEDEENAFFDSEHDSGPSKPPTLERQNAMIEPETGESGFSAASAESAAAAAHASAPKGSAGHSGSAASEHAGPFVPRDG